MRFNRNQPLIGAQCDEPDERDIKLAPSLWNASMDDAIRFGGELTRHVLSRLELCEDRRYITVDTKVHMLMKGMLPAIPGWHTDGVPRQTNGAPWGGEPMLGLQEELDEQGKRPRFHLLVTGDHCSTEFFTDPWDLRPAYGRADLYKDMTAQVNAQPDKHILTAPNSTWVRWDWWNIHRGVQASSPGWRFLIRVTESDFLPPKSDIREVIRLHNPVYMPLEYGW